MKLMLEIIAMLMSVVLAFFIASNIYDKGIYPPLNMLAVLLSYLVCLWTIFYIATKEKFRGMVIFVIVATQVSFGILIASGYVEKKSNEHVYITDKLDYKEGVNKDELFIFNYNSKQLKNAIEKYNN